MSEDLTFQDLLEAFQEDVFVGRAEQLTLFENALTAPRLPFLILAVSGQGGVGKTTLLEQYQRRAADHEALTAIVNEYQKTIPTVLAGLAEQLEDLGGDFKHFNERYRKYRELQEQIEADPQAPKGMLDFALRSVTRIGLRTLRRVPIAGEAADILLTDEAEDSVVDEASALAAYVARKFTNKDERILLLETDAELTRHFVTDLNTLLKKHRVILCFDTYEETVSVLDTWLRDLLSGKYGQFGGRVLFVVAGRYPLSQAWTGYRKAIRQIELNPFTEEEAREYLQSAGITSEDQITQLIALSERLPVLLAFLVSAPGDVPADVSGTAVERFLQSATSEQREAALVAAVPRYFNRDILAVVLGEQVSPATFDWLSSAHFVRPTHDGWRYHDVVRQLMFNYLRRRSPEEYATRHVKLSDYHYKQIGGPDAPSRYDDNLWCFHRFEALYHDLMQATEATYIKSVEAFLVSLAQSGSTSMAMGISYAWQQAAAEQGVSNVVTEWWKLLVTAALSPNEKERRTASLQIFQKAVVLRGLSTVALSIAYFRLAQIQIELRQYNAGFQNLKRWSELQPEDDAVKYSLRGSAYYQQQDYPAALADFTRTIELQPENGRIYFLRGLTYYRQQDYPAALADFTRAIELQPEDGDNYSLRGSTYYQQQAYPAALADFTRAIELQPENAFSYYWRGRTYYKQLDYPAALADLTRAIGLQPEDDTNYNWRGRTHYALADYPAALADFTRAIELQPEDGANYNWRGCTHYALADYPAALADFTRAIELQPENGVNYNWRGRTHYALADYPAALADFTRVIELEPEDGNNYYWRGRTHYALADYPAALADFTRAIEMQPEDGDNYYWRGKTHYEQHDYPAALADFTRAIELQPEDGANYLLRGLTYYQQQDDPAALADFTRAIELQPEDIAYYFYSLTDFQQRDFFQVFPKDNMKPLYIIAAGYARHELPEPACAFLRLAIEQNHEFLEHALTDPDFDPIRDTPCFQSLTNQLRVPVGESGQND